MERDTLIKKNLYEITATYTNEFVATVVADSEESAIRGIFKMYDDTLPDFDVADVKCVVEDLSPDDLFRLSNPSKETMN